jgi:hypothetical protein
VSRVHKLNQRLPKLNVVAAMNTTSYNVNIDDLARLARETCVYRGRSQGTKTAMPTTDYTLMRTSRIGKLLALFKR